jgi:hypothetical protein
METEDKINYVNNATVSYSPYEIRIEFCIETPSEDENEPATKQTIKDIRMSPFFAKDFLNVFAQSVDGYEKQFLNGKVKKTEKEV